MDEEQYRLKVMQENIKKAIILCAGEGTRLRPLTESCPKPMLKVGNKPLLERIICLLKKHGVNEIGINLFKYPDVIMDYFGDGSKLDVKIHYHVEKELLGTAGALNNFRWFLDSAFFVYYGDVVTNADLNNLISFHKQKKSIVTIGLYEVGNPTECGIVGTDKEMRILRFVEKPHKDEVFTNLANSGIYIMEKNVLDYIPDGLKYDFGKDLFPELLDRALPMYGLLINDVLIDIGSIKNYEKANDYFGLKELSEC